MNPRSKLQVRSLVTIWNFDTYGVPILIVIVILASNTHWSKMQYISDDILMILNLVNHV